jgi:hypothetical protein
MTERDMQGGGRGQCQVLSKHSLRGTHEDPAQPLDAIADCQQVYSTTVLRPTDARRRKNRANRKWVEVSDTTFRWALKVPRQCPLVLLLEVRLTEGKALGSEQGNEIGCEHP